MSSALLTEWSRLLVTSLVQAGVRHAVVCPGSRSTPFAWALASEPRLTVHSLIDERVAGFFALGLARMTNEPALVLSTSGSAAGSFFPAIIEASLSFTPLVVLTADRPHELQDAGAAQTIDQVKLYGAHVRAFFDLGTPDASPGSLAGLGRMAAQAVFEARWPEPGPVHVNARARKPLEPSSPETAADHEVKAMVDVLIERGTVHVSAPHAEPDPGAVSALASELARAARGVIVCGPLAAPDEGLARALAALGRRLGMPIFAEATSQLRFGNAPPAPTADALDWLCRSPAFLEALSPDSVLRIGATPTSSALERLLGAPRGPALHVIAPHGHSDPSNGARTLIRGEPRRSVELLVAALGEGTPHPEQAAYAERVAVANRAAWDAVDQALERSSTISGTNELRAVRAAVEAMPEGSVLVVGNSLPVREVDAVLPASPRRLVVASQRGANGIDGLIAGAAGVAMAANRPTLLLVGDVSFAHDLGGLAAARLVRVPFAIVVIDNDGGRIFDELPVARLLKAEPKHRDLWLTPPGLTVSHAASLFGLPHAAPQSVPELQTAVESALERPGPTVLHVRVLAESARHASERVKTALDTRLAELAPNFRN